MVYIHLSYRDGEEDETDESNPLREHKELKEMARIKVPETNTTLSQERVILFWEFVAERQRIWHRRHTLKKVWPWTNDPVLREFSFTNIYRQLDPGTYYVVDEILDTPYPAIDRMWNSIIYRVIGRESTHRLWGFQKYNSWDQAAFRAFLLGLEARGLSPFSIAYLTTSFGQFKQKGDPPDIAKTTLAPRGIQAWHNRFYAFYNRVFQYNSPEEVYKHLLTLPSIGNFYAYQITTDWSYPLINNHRGKNFLDFPTSYFSTWVKPGPGAVDGIAQLMGVEGKPEHHHKTNAANIGWEVISWLHSQQVAELDPREFPWLREGFTATSNGDGEIIPLQVSDVQNCLCEFSKWMKVTGNFGKARRKFVPPVHRDERWYILNKGISAPPTILNQPPLPGLTVSEKTEKTKEKK